MLAHRKSLDGLNHCRVKLVLRSIRDDFGCLIEHDRVMLLLMSYTDCCGMSIISGVASLETILCGVLLLY